MVLQNLLRSGDRILECGLEQPPPGFLQEEAERQRQQLDPVPGTGPGSATPGPGGGKDQNPPAQENLQPQQLLQWHPVLRLGSQAPQRGVPALDSESGSVLCHTHHLLTDRLAKWPPGLLDQALRAGLLEPRKTCPPRCQDPVLAPAQRPVHPGEVREGSGGQELVLSLPRCSCHGVLASGSGGIGPGEDPSETSDALLVLEGLGSEEVGGLAAESGDAEGEDTEKTERVVGAGTPGGAGTVFSSGTLSGLMRQVHRLAEEAGVCTDQSCRSSLAVLGATVTATPCPYLPSRSQPQSRAATPKLGVASGGAGRSASPLVVLEGEGGARGREGEKMPRGKSRKGGSLKVRLSKLFRTKSSSGGSGGLLDKRPSLASSTSSGGSLLDVWGSTCSNPDQDGETVSLVDVDISRRGGNSLHPPTPPPPPRRSLSLLGTSSFFLLPCGWYWGPMNWEDAEMKLKGKPDGSFLVRDSSDPRYILSLSFRSQGITHHTRMEHYRGTFSLWCHPKFEDRCHSVVEFIERAIMHSKNGKFLYFLRSRVPGLPPTPVQLLYPVSRFSSVKSLQHLCRFCIRQLVRIDHIQELPLPTPLIAYLRKFYYYDPEEEISPTLKEDKEQKERGTEGGGQPGVESQT
uniref:Suppressor of cytokine signaling 7 n=1 Tax=Neolamprologus brichardi TaxID=32507 RepID=A0A3Q4HSN8_NEOBR